MKFLLPLILLLTACTPRVVVKPELIEVPKYIVRPIAPELVAPIDVYWPDPMCFVDGIRVYCNGQLATMLLNYREALEKANADRQTLARQ